MRLETMVLFVFPITKSAFFSVALEANLSDDGSLAYFQNTTQSLVPGASFANFLWCSALV